MGRKARMRKLLREEDVEELLAQAEAEPETATATKPPKAETPVDKTLELQKSAGNRAVAAALQRWGGPGTMLAAQQQAKWPKVPQLLVGGKAYALEAWNDAGRTPGGAVGGAGRHDEEDNALGAGEFIVVLDLENFADEVAKAIGRNQHYTTVEIVVPTKDGKGFRWILTDVLITSYQVSSGAKPSVTLTLSFRKRELAHSPPPPKR